MMKLFFALSSVLLSVAALPVSGIEGNWKRTSMTLTESNGKATDMMAMMTQTMPCTKDIIYAFKSGGFLESKVPEACGAMKKTIESMNANGKWALSGNRLIVTTSMKEIPPATYEISIKGNTMTWTFNYTDNPKMPNPTHAKHMTIVYQRV
ncbi:lipocalin family protein [Spirosoma sp. SC4-14]|uniref:lipocalin family protein n=1 Tax=Spirosoma sp. SC4-14 TaxID=3128900 RepID=UPI0030D35EFB